MNSKHTRTVCVNIIVCIVVLQYSCSVCIYTYEQIRAAKRINELLLLSIVLYSDCFCLQNIIACIVVFVWDGGERWRVAGMK